MHDIYRVCFDEDFVGIWSKSRYYKEGNVQSKKCQAIRR